MITRADSGAYVMPQEVMEALRPHLEAMGALLPDVVNMVPAIDLGTPIREMAIQCGQLLKRAWLFKYGDEDRLVTFEENKMVTMTPIKFPGWIEKHVKVQKSRFIGQEMRAFDVSMGKDVAAKLLETHELLRELPHLKAVIATRCPVPRKDGKPGLCGRGWDEEAELWCKDEVPYELDWTVQTARDYLEEVCRHFLFADAKDGVSLWENRSFLVHVAAMLGVYCRRLLPPGTIRPLALYIANDQGSGKSLLVAMVLSGCFGMASNTDLPLSQKGLNQEKFTALLETVARAQREILWLDDVPQGVFSNALNRFTTSSKHEGRCYGDNSEMFESANVTQVFMTGNQVRPSRDIMQRSLVCELFLPMESEARKFENPMTALWLAQPEQRAKMLASLWALTRNWIEKDMPRSPTLHGRSPDWSRLVGGIMMAAGVTADPFEIPTLPTGGDQETEEWKHLLQVVADEGEEWVKDMKDKSYTVDMEKLTSAARKHALLPDLFGTNEDGKLRGGDLKKIGIRLAKYRGRADLKTTSGRRFEFGKRKQASHYVYPITWLDPWGDEPEDVEEEAMPVPEREYAENPDETEGA